MSRERAQTRLTEKTLSVWRVVAEAGPDGIGSSPVHARLPLSTVEITTTLLGLKRGGYIERRGSNRWGTWLVSATCKVPKDEPRPAWLSAAAVDDENDTAKLFNPRVPATVAMPAAPASVFTLAQAPLPPTAFGPRNERPPVEKAPQPAIATHAVLDWKSPKNPLPAPIDADAEATPAAQRAPVPKREFVCSVDSDGAMYIYSNGGELMLDLVHTRKLLHYLDHLRAADLVAAVRVQEEQPA